MTVSPTNNRVTSVIANQKLKITSGKKRTKANLFLDFTLGNATQVDLAFSVKDVSVDNANEYVLPSTLTLNATKRTTFQLDIPLGVTEVFVDVTPTGADTSITVLNIGSSPQ